MKKYLYLILIFLTACPGLQTRNEIRTKDGRMDAFQSTGGTASRPAPTRAEQAAEEETLRDVIRRLNGTVEELAFRVSKLEETSQSKAIENRLDFIEQRILSLGESLILLEQGRASQKAQTISPTAQAEGPFEKAEALFKQSNWKAAILEYNKYRDNFPKGKSYSEATYKIGVCFQELGMNSEARSFYAEVIEKFPKSKSAKSAKYRLNQIKN